MPLSKHRDCLHRGKTQTGGGEVHHYKTGAAVMINLSLVKMTRVISTSEVMMQTRVTKKKSRTPSQMLCCEQSLVFLCSSAGFCLFFCWGINSAVLVTKILHLHILHFGHTTGHGLNEMLHRASTSSSMNL